jgi:uncharacterized protein YhaN
VAAALGLRTADPLETARVAKRRLDEARAVAARRVALREEAEQRERELRDAEAALSAAEAALGDVRELTRAEDRVTLVAALDAARDRRVAEAAADRLNRTLTVEADGAPLPELEAACAGRSAEELAAEAALLAAHAETQARAAQEAERTAVEAALKLKGLDRDMAAAQAAAQAEEAKAELESATELYLLKRTQRILLDHSVRRLAQLRRNPLLARASELFRTLTLGRYADLRVDYEADKPRLIGLSEDGRSVVQVAEMSEGTRDQLFLALRLAAVEQTMAGGAPLPFFADDLFVSFDDDRARAGLEVLGELSRTTQVLFFTHHDHLRQLAAKVLPALHSHGLGMS